MSVWLTIPSARPPAEANTVLAEWRRMGYRIALWLDHASEGEEGQKILDEWDGRTVYPGYAVAINSLIQIVMAKHADAEFFIIGGDDTLPDPNVRADEIAAQCREHFHSAGCKGHEGCRYPETFGVMQPTGHRWHEGKGGFTNAPIDRVAGSAWIGREFAKRAYGGSGPLFPGYTHMYVDEELQCVAEKLGVFWQRRDLVQIHQHWGRGATDSAVLNDPVIPPHLEKWNTDQHWQSSKKLFNERKAAGFPGHEPK
jgi:hypothetical protein